MNAFTCLLHLPRHIHSPFHFKCSAALLWVAALSPRPSRCTHRSFCLSLSLGRVIYCIRENFVVYVHVLRTIRFDFAPSCRSIDVLSNVTNRVYQSRERTDIFAISDNF